MSEIVVFTARRIHTMNPSNPVATAVAVRDGRILEASSMERLAPWLADKTYRIDDRFSNRTILPGFIDPHLHPSMAAVLLPMEFVTAVEWRLPWASTNTVTTPEGFLGALHDLHARKTEGDPLFVWGYHQLWHGKVGRQELNAISAKRPLSLIHI